MEIKELESLFLSYSKNDFIDAESSAITCFLVLLSWIEKDRVAQQIFIDRDQVYWDRFWKMIVEKRRLLFKKIESEWEKIDCGFVGESVENKVSSNKKDWNTMHVYFTPSANGLGNERRDVVHMMWQADDENSISKLVLTCERFPLGASKPYSQCFVYQSEDVAFNNEFLTVLFIHYFLNVVNLFFMRKSDVAAFSNPKISSAIVNLIYQQAKSHDALENVIEDEKIFSDSVEQFLSSFDLSGVSQGGSISLFDLLSVSYKIKTHQSLSSFDLSLLTNSLHNSQDVRDVISQNNLTNSLYLVDHDEQKQVVQKLQQDLEFNARYKIGNIYAITNPSISHDLSCYQQTSVLLHGTSNVSVISILRDSLLPVSKVRGDHVYTGSSLGDGVYFARLTESGKPVAYTDATDMRFGYLIIAEVGFNYVEHVDQFGHQALRNGGLLIADKVGRGDRDELCVYNENQINLKYLIEVKKK